MTTDGATAIIPLEGHIDSSNTPQTESEIFATPDLANFKYIVIDAEKLDYISSAGLRVILKLRKICPELKIIGFVARGV